MPAACKRSTTVAVTQLIVVRRLNEPADAAVLAISILSLMATGTPCNGLKG